MLALVLLVVSTLSFNFNVLLPVLAKQTLHSGPEIFGVVTACFGAGALVGALVSATIARASSRLLVGGTAAFGVAELALATQSTLDATAPLLFVAGGSPSRCGRRTRTRRSSSRRRTGCAAG